MAKPTHTPTDDVLARRIHAGEQQAFTTLIRRYERSLVALIRHRKGARICTATTSSGSLDANASIHLRTAWVFAGQVHGNGESGQRCSHP